MWRYLILAGSLGIAATQAPTILESLLDGRNKTQQAAPQGSGTTQNNVTALSDKKIRKDNSATKSLAGRKVRIKAGYGGHYYADVRMNNRPVKVLVDTGATSVAINETTARKIGIHLKPSDFKYKVNTANGQTKMASAIIREIQIGNIRVKNVHAAVAKDKSLSGTLLGMSFLKKLKRFEISGDMLLLEQ